MAVPVASPERYAKLTASVNDSALEAADSAIRVLAEHMEPAGVALALALALGRVVHMSGLDLEVLLQAVRDAHELNKDITLLRQAASRWRS